MLKFVVTDGIKFITKIIEWLCERTEYVPQPWNWENHS